MPGNWCHSNTLKERLSHTLLDFHRFSRLWCVFLHLDADANRPEKKGRRQSQNTDPKLTVFTPHHIIVGFGLIVDRLASRRAPFVFSLLLTFASTLGFALATTLPVLLVARLLEGLSTAIVAVVGNALMCNVVEPKRLGRAMGLSSMALSIGLLVGPVLGGVLYEYCGYFETFLPALALVGIEVGLRCLMVESGDANDTTVTVKSGDTKTTVANTCSNDPRAAEETGVKTDAQNTTDPESQPLLQSRPPTTSTHPRQNTLVVLLTNARFLTSLFGVFILSSIAYGFDAVLGPYISATFDLGPIHVAGLFLALAIPQLLSPLTGVVTDRHGPRTITVAGVAVGLPSLLSLSLLAKTTAHPVLKLYASFFCLGIALALAMVPLKVDAISAIEAVQKARPGVFGPKGAQGIGFGLINGVIASAGLIGPLGAGWLRIWIGWAGMTWVMCGLISGVLGSVVGFTGEGPDRKSENARPEE